MNDYTFIDNNNGHYEEYFNFTSNATKQQIIEATNAMIIEDSSYLRRGSSVHNLREKLIKLGYEFSLKDNDRKRRHIDRIGIDCISGNY